MSVLTSISSFLPPPQYLGMPNAGVDISDTSLKYIQFQPDPRSGSSLQLKSWGDIDIPDGVLTRGDVTDGKKLADALREVRERTGVEHIRVSLPEERAYLFETNIKKGTSFKEIRGLLEFRLEENVPLSPRDAYFDYHIFNTKGKNSLKVAVTVYAKETINGYYDACQTAGVTPLSFEVEAQAIARSTLPKNDKGTHMIVDFGKTRTGIGVVHNGILMYTSTIDIGGSDLSKSLRAQLGNTEESELTSIKNTQGLVQSIAHPEISEALLSSVGAIKDEVELRVQYWNNIDKQNKDRFIESIVLCGGSVNLKGLPGYFSDELGVESKRVNIWRNVLDLNENIPPIGRRYSYGYATAVGLGLTSFI